MEGEVHNIFFFSLLSTLQRLIYKEKKKSSDKGSLPVTQQTWDFQKSFKSY